jgi:hypothetical protein
VDREVDARGRERRFAAGPAGIDALIDIGQVH